MGLSSKIKPVFYVALGILPKTRVGDWIHSFLHFVMIHRRLPNRGLFNDYLFKQKNSAAALDPLRAYVSDKAFVKNYVRDKIGPQYNVPTLAVLETMEEVRAFDFPARCCIKPTHLSGQVILREDGEAIDFKTIEAWLSANYYNMGREYNYRQLQPKIIVEPLIFDRTDNEDLKFFCFKGKAKFVQIDIGRRGRHTRLYFDRDWTQLPFSILKPISDQDYPRPKNFEKLIELAEALAQEFEFIRVDFYTDGDAIMLGELTNYPENGKGYFVPRSAETLASKLLFE